MYRPCRNSAPAEPTPPHNPAWPGPGCYVSPFPASFSEQYDYSTGDYVKIRQHFFPEADGTRRRCNPTACRECERERTWHDHGETEA